MATMVDIHKALRAVGIDGPAAEAIAQTGEARTRLATKADLEVWRQDLLRELSELKGWISRGA